MCECLRLLGATIYHLATGHSEFNAGESVLLDKFRYEQKEIDDKLWTKINYLLSGQVYSLPEARALFSRKIELLKRMRLLIADLKQRRQGIPGIPWGKVASQWPEIRNSIATGLRVVLIPTTIGYLWFNIMLSDVALVIMSLVIGGSAGLILLMIAKDRNVSEKGRSLCVSFGLVIVLYFLFSTFTCLTRPSMEGVVVIDRQTQKFVARLPRDYNDSYLAWNNNFFNHFKYELKFGVPMKGAIDADFLIDEQKEKNQNRHTNASSPYKVHYQLDPSSFRKFMSEYKDRDALEKMIKSHIDQAAKSTKEYLVLINSEKIPVPISEVIENKELRQTMVNRVNDRLFIKFKEELAKIKISGVTLTI